jgi:predicted transcriptional regulator
MAGRKPETPDTHYLAVFLASDDPVMTSVEVGDELGVTQQGAHSRLSSLDEGGLLESKKVGSRARVYWITNTGIIYLAYSIYDAE